MDIQRMTLQEYAALCGGELGPYDEFDFGDNIGISNWLIDSTAIEISDIHNNLDQLSQDSK